MSNYNDTIKDIFSGMGGNDIDTRIFLTDLSAYNQGYLVGEWIDLPCDNLHEKLAAILKEGEAVCNDGTHEEYFITDYESLFTIHEFEDINLVNDKAATLETLDETELKKLKFLEWQGEDFSNALEKLDDVMIYENMSFEDLAYELVDESWEVPEHLLNYIDYDKFASELEMDYTDLDGDLFYNYY